MITIPGTDKFFAHSENVNTTISGSESALEESHWYTIDDLSNTVKPYKVFTALLTQSGGDDPLQLISGPVTKGVTYKIVNSDGDFSNVGAPNNNDGTYFIAINNETPINYGPDGVLTYDTGAPVATVLENTIGDVWFSYVDVGNYFINSNDLFTQNKTINTLTQTANISSLSDTPYYAYCTIQNANELEILILDSTLTVSNDLLYNKLIEIRVYN